MPSKKTSQIRKADLETWLASLGFERGNPFSAVVADEERNLLPEYFVAVDGYERIKGEKTTIVFAPRGGGKSALRIVLASYSAPNTPGSRSLAVEYTDFAPLVSKLRNGDAITIEDHTLQILRLAVGTLFRTIFGDRRPVEADKIEDGEWRAKKLSGISAPIRARISQWVRAYQPQLLSPMELYERLNSLEAAFAPDWGEFYKSAADQRLQQLIAASPLQYDTTAQFLADLNDFPRDNIDPSLSPREKFSELLMITEALGFDSLYFLVDRLDETKETSSDYESQVKILESLIADLPILELPGMAFKFFLSQETYGLMVERTAIRRDRITDEAVTVRWSKDLLKHLLDERLFVYSDGTVHELLQICQGTSVSVGKGISLSAGEWIEGEMLRVAQACPRRLLLGGRLLFEAHYSRRGPKGLVEPEDWNIAKKNLMQIMPPLLRLHEDVHIVQIVDLEVRLTPLQYRILLTLAHANGPCDRQSLIEHAWEAPDGEGVTPAAIDKAMSRLREVLNDDPNYPVYLRTIKGRGYQLINHEIVNFHL